MEMFLLWFWLRLDGILHVISGLTIFFALCSLMLWVWIRTNNTGPFCESESEVQRLNQKHAKLRFRLKVGFVIGLMFSTLMPNAKETAILVAGYYAVQLSKTPEAGKVYTLIRSTANKMLDAALKEAAK